MRNFSDVGLEACQSFGVPVSTPSRNPEKRFQGQKPCERLAKWLEKRREAKVAKAKAAGSRIAVLVESINKLRKLVLELRRQAINGTIAVPVDFSLHWPLALSL